MCQNTKLCYSLSPGETERRGIAMPSSLQPLVKPKALKPGDTIAIISPAAPTLPTTSGDCLFEQGITRLESLGYQVKLMPNAKKSFLYLAGSDQERLDDLHQAFADPDVDAILCARGGYGCMRLLPNLDFDLIGQHPKILAGFSDITALLVPLYMRLGLVGFYAPMLTSNLVHHEPFSETELIRQLDGSLATVPSFRLPNLDTYTCLNPGMAEGRLTGGNLSLLTALCGTPYQMDATDHILFIEDWKECYYTLDRKFQQLEMSGVFNGIKGLVLCDFSEIETLPEQPLPKFLQFLTHFLRVPVGYGFSIGHGTQTGTLPYGVKAAFNADMGTLTLLESAVCMPG
jgi:muramoyltetrapeptide carboxypeptidase